MNIKWNPKKDLVEYLTLGIAITLSIASYLWSLKNGYTIVYNDAMSHLNIARLVIDCIEPNFAQLGSVWLPLNHVLSLSLIWNDWAWHSGFAGSIFSMIAYVFSVWGIYKIILEVTNNKLAGFAGAMVIALNLNMLYLQTTPLTEPLYVSFFILSIFSFIKWLNTDNFKYLLLLGFFGFLQVLIRYDGWFVVSVEGLLILYHQIFCQKEKINKTIGKFIIFAFPIVFGAGLWLIWNFLIFGNPLFFAFGDNSAHAQQTFIEKTSGLITKHNLIISFKAYWYSVIGNIGKYLIAFSCLSALFFLFKRKIELQRNKKILIIILLSSPFVFNVISLYFGFSIINMPQLNWNIPLRSSSQWFNVRYGIMALPFIAFFIGILVNLWKKSIIILLTIIFLIVYQNFLLFSSGPIVLLEGVYDEKASETSNVADTLKKVVGKNEKILVSTAVFSSVLFKTGLSLNYFIHEGVSKQWKYALKNPENFAEWILLRENYAGDPIYRSLIIKNSNNFNRYYKLIYEFRDANIYKLRTQNETIIFTENADLTTWKNKFKIIGVNSYDLAYRSKKEINETFKELSKIGVNTIRFWAFGDGSEYGFQSRAGIMNEERLKRMDFIITMAVKYKIRLIPVLVNNWDDYGGKKQYLEWTGFDIENGDLFFSEIKPRELFKNYINHIVPRKNTITGYSYSDEPAILSWEIMNEPRISFGKQEILREWTQEISSYIKEIDKNHLVSIGSEEEIEIGANNENKAIGLCGLPEIDICSTHLYLFHDNKQIYKDFNHINKFLSAQFEFSQKENKPILLGEFGVSKQTRPFNDKPLDVAKKIIGSANKMGYNGYLIWNWGSVPNDYFGFSIHGFNDKQYNIKNLEEIINK